MRARRIKRICQAIPEYSGLLGDFRKQGFDMDPLTVIDLGPTKPLEEMIRFINLMLGENSLEYSVERRVGTGDTFPIGIGGKLLGTGFGLDFEFNSNHYIKYIQERGVFKSARKYVLERYAQEPALGQLDLYLDMLQDRIASELEKIVVDVVRECTTGGPCSISTILSSELILDNQLDYDSIYGPISFDFITLPGPIQPSAYLPMDTFGPADKPHYGLGGFHIYYPKDLILTQPATLVLDYYDHEITGIDESSIAIYRLNPDTRDWEHAGGVLDTSSNTVTTTITQMGAYTLGPAMPAGKVVWAQQEFQESGDEIIVTLTSEPLTKNNGDPVENGAIFHVISTLPNSYSEDGSVVFGTILTTDVAPDVDGMQVTVENNVLQVRITYPSEIFAQAEITVFSDIGTAFGDEVISREVP